MCGIVGIYSDKTTYLNSDISNMLQHITYRGPDDEGIIAFDTKKKKIIKSKGNLLFGHKRLSILDLSPKGHQPMSNKDKSLWITYNGEIFNFKEIRKELEKKGYSFVSNTDTEVILYAYEEYEKKCLDLFRGFFAFCIYDVKKEELFLARDRLGSKPLKYYFDGNTFAFASEMKSFYSIKEIEKNISLDSISEYLSLKYIPAPKTIFKDISKLCAGNYMTFSLKNKKLKINKYWEPVFEPKIDINYTEAKIKTKEILADSINIRMISDVPVGIFLSGGIDSSSIVALLREKEQNEINTFSVGFSDTKFDERKYAKEISKIFNTNHQEFIVEPNLTNDLEMIVNNYDEPFADPSMIPTYYLAKEVSKYVKVVLGGDGADEMLGGYKRYSIHLRNSFLNILPKKFLKFNNSFISKIPYAPNKSKGYGKIARIVESLSGDLIDTYYLRLTGYSKKQKFHLFDSDIKQIETPIWNDEIYNYFKRHQNLSNIDKLMVIDQITHLPEYILTKSDISGMANSLETRAPFIDVKFIEWVNKLDSSFKIKNYSKRILKDILLETGVPKHIIHRKKAGFTPPLKKWLRKEDSLLKYFMLDKNSILSFLNKNIMQKMYNHNIANDYNLSNQLWVILVLGIWMEKNKDYIEMDFYDRFDK